jgi:hypothetical protein
MRDPGTGSGSGSAAHSPTPPLIGDGDAVFFVGNSFMSFDGRSLPEWVRAIGLSVEPAINIEVGSNIVFGNTPLQEFLRHEATSAALKSGKYEVFVLQGEEFEAVKQKAQFHDGVRRFHREITAAGGKTVLFMTWEFSWEPFIEELAASYDEIGRELGIPVIPVGLIYKDCDANPLPNRRPYWLIDELHQNAGGSAINAFATFQMLTGINPSGVNFSAPGNTNTDGEMHYFSQMAWMRVRPRLILE